MYKLDNFKTCCDYLGIDNTLPVCQIDERQIQAAYKLRVCVRAWNKQDGFEPDETANWKDDNVGYAPFFLLKDGRLLSAGLPAPGAYTGIVAASTFYAGSFTTIYFGLRLSLKTRDRAIEFGKTFIDIFNELI